MGEVDIAVEVLVCGLSVPNEFSFSHNSIVYRKIQCSLGHEFNIIMTVQVDILWFNFIFGSNHLNQR